METRTLGRTGLRLGAFTFGCGAIGGLMVGGSPQDQREAVATALGAGINYFDTAPFYGSGASETNLGRVLAALGNTSAYVGTKMRLPPDSSFAAADMAAAIEASLDGSLRRLGRDGVDLLQLHHPLSAEGRKPGMTADFVLNAIAPAMQRLQAQGKVRFIGITALGDAAEIGRVIESGAFDTAQVAFNLLNASAGGIAPRLARPVDDYAGMLETMAAHGTGTIGIRILAGGALSGTLERDPIAAKTSIPVGQGIGMGADYAADVEAAKTFGALIDAGEATSLVDLSLRYALSNPLLSTMALGLSSLEHLRVGIASFERGPLSAKALEMVARVQAAHAGAEGGKAPA
jgi:aryl-alcohol dehydrogenase-like predicted oxidoreductase